MAFSTPSPASQRFAHLTRERADSDSKLYSPEAAKKIQIRVFAQETKKAKSIPLDDDVSQPCLKCKEKCQGYMPHSWRKTCLNCGCSKAGHKRDLDPKATELYLQHLHLGTTVSRPSSTESRQLDEKYAWYPPNTSLELVEKYMDGLPEEVRPVKGSPGENYRAQQFVHQLPLYDFSPDKCHQLSESEVHTMGKFTDKRAKKFHGAGVVEKNEDAHDKVCTVCSEAVPVGSVYIRAERAGPEEAWHPGCFKCATCEELLVDLVYYYSPEKASVYCGRHHAELLGVRCAACDELIFAPTYTEAQGKKWHKQHFCCSMCDEALQGKPHGNKNGKLFCERCYNRLSEKCQRCKESIILGAKKVSVKGNSWHEACFVCKRCKEDLREQRYYPVDGDVYCGECMQPVGQCQGCKGAISSTVSFLKHKSRCWHAECFKCVNCRAWLVSGQFQELGDFLVCYSCYVNKVAKKCSGCNEPVLGRAIQFAKKFYHPQCFACKKCEKVVGSDGNERMKDKDGEPICQDCYLKLFTMKCYKCHQPITTRYTVYKDKPFHMQCFTCNTCGASVARGDYYETSLFEILCSRCVNK